MVVSDETGAYILPSLPVGPYQLEFALSGFRTFVQTGIVLQVNSNPTVNATLPVGNLSETISVEAQTPLIETRSSGIGMVVENERVLELPLNGRQTLDLIYLTGMAAPSGTLSGARGGAAGAGSPGTIAVAGGLPNGTAYVLDGSTHNDPYNNAAMPFPFPEALQEFKVETSALPAQYGYHSAAVVNAVTKSGTDRISGSLFEFSRDDALNATDPFSAVGADGKRRSDGLNRNQFGGSFGGPIVRDRMFYFVAYQRTRVRRVPTSSFQFIPTPAMLAGDFTGVMSPACNGGRQLPALRAPFADNRVDPALFSPASLKLTSLLGAVRTIRAARYSSTASTTAMRTSSRPKSTTRSAARIQSSAVCRTTSTTRRRTTTARRPCRSASRRSRIASTRWRSATPSCSATTWSIRSAPRSTAATTPRTSFRCSITPTSAYGRHP